MSFIEWPRASKSQDKRKTKLLDVNLRRNKHKIASHHNFAHREHQLKPDLIFFLAKAKA